jgi:hypothetical protein
MILRVLMDFIPKNGPIRKNLKHQEHLFLRTVKKKLGPVILDKVFEINHSHCKKYFRPIGNHL